MGKHYILILLILLLLLPFSSVKAECSLSEVSRLTKIANNVNVSYVFDEDGGATYDITITNLTKELYLLETTTNKKYNYNSKNNEVVISNVAAGKNLKMEIYVVDKKCYTSKLVSKTVSLPAYNSYYKDPLCEKATEHPLCQRFTRTSVTEAEFKKTINQYIKEHTPAEEENPTSNNFWLDLFLEYYWALLGIIIITGTTIIIIHHNKNKLF